MQHLLVHRLQPTTQPTTQTPHLTHTHPHNPPPHTQGMAQGALVTALGLSNQALYDEDVRTAVEQGGGHLPQITAEGPDIAPHAAPRALCGA